MMPRQAPAPIRSVVHHEQKARSGAHGGDAAKAPEEAAHGAPPLLTHPPGPMRTELELLLLSTRPHLDDAVVRRIARLSRQRLDWDFVLGAAKRHGVASLVCRNLLGACAENVPEPVRARLRKRRMSAAFYGLGLTAQLVRILSQFEAAGISALPFKGPVLAAAVYGDATMRLSSDLDIWVPEDRLLEAAHLLMAEGYRTLQGHTTPTDLRPLLKDPARQDVTFARGHADAMVEVHWRLLERTRHSAFDFDDAWTASQEVRVGGSTVRTLGSEQLLPYLCLHGAKHAWGRLIWLCDVDALVQGTPSLDWARVRQEARSVGALRALHLGLRLAHDLLGTPIPPDAHAPAQEDRGAAVLAWFIRKRLYEERSWGRLEADLFWAATMDSSWRGGKYLLHRFVTPTKEDDGWVSLQGPWRTLHYLLRPIRLLRARFE